MKRHVLFAAIACGLLASCASGGGSKSGDIGGNGVNVTPDYQPPPNDPEWSYPRNAMNLNEAQKNFNGNGVLVGIFDTTIDTKYIPLQGQAANNPQISDGQPSNIDDKGDNHGTAVATVLLGKPWGAWQGGVAPDATFIFTNRGSALNFRQMADRGISVLNMSVQTDLTVEHSNAAAQRDYLKSTGLLDAYRYLKDKGVVIVYAAGNASAPNPSTGAAAPYYFPDLTNWITVGALDYNGTAIASYSNDCGVMAQQCVVAPGTWRLVWPTPGKPADYSFRWTGTSFAAPAVSGVAALVKEAFPWMDGTEIAQTIFTTAKDMGAPGVDEVYGWGAVDAGKAVLGPGTLTAAWNASIPAGTTSVFGNDINGPGSLTIDGQGLLVLDGHDTYAGGTFVQSGGLSINGSVAGDVVQHDGWVGGRGVIGGDLLQQSGGLVLEAGNPLTVMGNAKLNGVVDLRPGEGFTGQSQGLALQSGTISGTYSLANDALFYTSQVTQQGNQLWGSVSRQSGAQALQEAGVGDATTRAAAANLDRVFAVSDARNANGGTSTASEEALLAQAQGLRQDSTAAVSLDSLAGQAHATARGMSLTTLETQQHWMADRVRDATDSPEGGAWIMAGHQDGVIRPADAFNADVESDSIVAGIDKRVGEHTVLGVAVQSGETRSNFNRFGGNVHTQQAGVSVYGAWQASDDWSVGGHVGVSKLDNDVERIIAMGSLAGVQSDTDATAWSAGLKAERRLSDQWSLVGQLTYDRLRSDGFSEEGVSGFELVAAPSTTNNTTAGIGVLFHDGKPVAQVGWKWSGEAMYLRTLGEPDTGFQAHYAGLNDAWFKVDGMKIAQDSAWLSGRVGYRFSNQGEAFLSTYLKYNSNGTDHSLVVGYRKDF